MKPLTPEEEKEQIRRAFAQKQASLAEGILFNLMQNPSLNDICRNATPAEIAEQVSLNFMEVVYHQRIKLTEEEE